MISMKITTRELDTSLIERIERLDGITMNFSEADKAGFVSYNGEKFLIKHVNETFLNEIYNNNDFDYLNNHLYQESEYTKNSFNSKFNVNNVASKNITNQLVIVEGIPAFQAQGNIRKIRKYDTYMLVMDELGIFYRYNFKDHKLDFSLNLVDKIKKVFAIETIQSIEFLDFEIYNGGFLVSTLSNGVFFADVTNNSLEVKFAENNVVEIEDMKNGNVMLVHSDGTILIYNFKVGMRVETINYLKKTNQIFKGMYIDNNNLFILGRPIYSNSTDNLLHTWNIDPSGSMNNITGLVKKGYDNTAYQPLHISGDINYIYISGIKDNHNVFVWKYNRKQLDQPFEEIILNAGVDYLNFIEVNNNSVLLNIEDRLLNFDATGRIVKNIQLKTDTPISKIYTKEQDKELLVVSGKYIILYRLPEYKVTNDILLEIYKSDVTSNNIDILIKSNKELTNVVFLNAEGAQVIEPFYKVQTKVGTVYKIMNSTAKTIDLRLGTLGDTEIEGVVVNSNNVYTK
jgi:hypothetical protein